LYISRKQYSAKEAQELDKKALQARDWVNKIRPLSKKLALDLSKTVDSCDEFCRNNAVDFQNIQVAGNERISLRPIKATLRDLISLKRTLESFDKACDGYTRDVS
jgi:hypothetical protein